MNATCEMPVCGIIDNQWWFLIQEVDELRRENARLKTKIKELESRVNDERSAE